MILNGFKRFPKYPTRKGCLKDVGNLEEIHLPAPDIPKLRHLGYIARVQQQMLTASTRAAKLS